MFGVVSHSTICEISRNVTKKLPIPYRETSSQSFVPESSRVNETYGFENIVDNKARPVHILIHVNPTTLSIFLEHLF
jgi:hypothetical protein